MLGANRTRRWLAGLALAAVVAGGTAVALIQRPAKAAAVGYTCTFRGVTRLLNGMKVPFVATGPATVDVVTGAFSYDVTAPAIEAAIGGTGTLATGEHQSFGQSSFDSGTWQGTAIILGKFNKDLSKFRGKIVVSIPNQLGPAPNGFTYTTGTVRLDVVVE